MSVARLFSIEFGAFLLLFTFLLGRQLLSGLLLTQRNWLLIWHEPENHLLFIMTLIVGSRYCFKLHHGMAAGRLPDIPTEWLVAFGCCCAIYLGAKVLRFFEVKLH